MSKQDIRKQVLQDTLNFIANGGYVQTLKPAKTPKLRKGPGLNGSGHCGRTNCWGINV